VRLTDTAAGGMIRGTVVSRLSPRHPRRMPRPASAAVLTALLALVLAAGALGAGSRGVNEEPNVATMGSSCEASEGSVADTIFQDEISDGRFEARAPFNGVVTQWIVRLGYTSGPFQLSLSVINQLGESIYYEVKAQTAPATIDKPVTVIHAHLPIYKGEALALTSVGEGPMPICGTQHPASNNVRGAGRSMKSGESLKFLREGGLVPFEARIQPGTARDRSGQLRFLGRSFQHQ
jgi:hypothetical protein